MRKGGYVLWRVVLLVLSAACVSAESSGKHEEPSELERYISEAMSRSASHQRAPGSLYTPAGPLAELSRDLRARQVDDIVTIVVADSASAVSRGGTSTGRKASARAGVTSLAGVLPAASALVNLADLHGSQELQGQGETSRETVLTTTISARVTHALPNGNMVVEGHKEIWVNSERQQVTVRGIVRWNDIDGGNQVTSDRLAHLEVRVNGKGVVGDAIRRPNLLYRILLGILPF